MMGIQQTIGFVLLSIVCAFVFAGGGYERPAPVSGSYICFDGKLLHHYYTGYAWRAKRGCFVSRKPCKLYRAGFYGYYPEGRHLMQGFAQCREDYPFKLGEMETH